MRDDESGILGATGQQGGPSSAVCYAGVRWSGPWRSRVAGPGRAGRHGGEGRHRRSGAPARRPALTGLRDAAAVAYDLAWPVWSNSLAASHHDDQHGDGGHKP